MSLCLGPIYSEQLLPYASSTGAVKWSSFYSFIGPASFVPQDSCGFSLTTFFVAVCYSSACFSLAFDILHYMMMMRCDLKQWLKCKIRGGGTLHSGLGP